MCRGTSAAWAVIMMALVLLAGSISGADAAPRPRSSRAVKLPRKVVMDYLVDNDQTCVITPGVKFFDTPIGIAYADAAKFVLAQMPDSSVVKVDKVRTSCNMTADGAKRLRVVITTAPVELLPVKTLITNLRNGYYAQVAKEAYAKLGDANSAWWPCTIQYLTKFNSVCRAKTSCIHRNGQWQQLTAADLPALLTADGYCISQTDALLDLKKAFPGGVTDTWDPNTPTCSWEGITCDENGDVVKVDLGGNLVGSIPPGGFKLPFTVTEIDFSGNPSSGKVLSGEFPSGMTFPPNLKTANFANNQFTGGLANLGNGMPPGIQQINLSGNQLGIPGTELTYTNLKNISPFLTDVQVFDISGNPGLTPDANAAENMDMSSMESLVNWSTDNYGNMLPPQLKRMVRSLNLGSFNTNSFPFNLILQAFLSVFYKNVGMMGQFRNITLPSILSGMDVSNNKLSGEFFVTVPEGSVMKFIDASDNQITSLKVSLPKKCQDGFKMDFSNNKITELPPNWDATLCSNLQEIDMKGNPLECTLQSWPNLKSTKVFLSKAAADKMCAPGGKVPTTPIYVVADNPNYQWLSCDPPPVNPCLSNPCLNGGECLPTTLNADGYECYCVDYWVGTNCETDSLSTIITRR